ncbi:hypothetical protein PXD04_11205 (plasmid) [Methanosphaera sp. ISO3-F5]|uniref:hypothetical protein n=1 Tax=Methanosphaera sp. ISO3-F5 TaxID=1452353 RepID=UPI002B25F887|nr:hypothetical protein [Methanosphaera sp. ISO3-F5]WQH65442.1 hypothetical protein PXD04_11205 [Methanosphaera sp. ISO3-F5]
MKYTIKIQKNRSIHLPLKIRNKIKTEELNKVEWTLSHNNNTIQIKFIKETKTPPDKISGNTQKIYRNIYTQSTIKVPNIIYNHLNCKTLDYIILEIKDKHIHVNTQKRTQLAEISALIKNKEKK